MDQSSVLVIVLTEHSDDVAFLNKTLRDAGHRVQCRGLSRLDDLQQALEQHTPHLLIFCPDHHSATTREVVRIKLAHARLSPLILVQSQVTESDIGAATEAGAQDLVSLEQVSRICSVCERELRTFRLEHALNEALRTANDYRQQAQSLISESVDAIALVQEGIVVQANQSWTDIFAGTAPEEGLGPLMDYFADASQALLKGALIACAKGQWDDEVLRVDARIAPAKTRSVEIKLELASFDGEPATRLNILQRNNKDAGEPIPDSVAERALTTDPVTGFLTRQQFLEALNGKLEQRGRSSSSALAIIRPDKFGQIEHDIGPVYSEELLGQIAQVIDRLKGDSDLIGRLGGTQFGMVIERGSLRDIEAWAQNLLKVLREHIFEVSDRSLSLTCSIGLAELGTTSDQIEHLFRSAGQASRTARANGGNKIVLEETTELTVRTQQIDALRSQQITSALAANRFRLMHMNIASLAGHHERNFDTFVRMIDEQNDEISASDFMNTAARMDLVRPIDRWVINASIGFCASHASDLVFVKLSQESVLDSSLRDWICQQVVKSCVRPDNLCFQVSEADAGQYQKQTIALAESLRRRGFRFAVEQFGIGRGSIQVLSNIPMDYVKLDGSLMQSVANDAEIQKRISNIVAHANRRDIKTIAARVENANTMAVLFQLGVGYMQGHYVHEPEVVLEDVG